MKVYRRGESRRRGRGGEEAVGGGPTRVGMTVNRKDVVGTTERGRSRTDSLGTVGTQERRWGLREWGSRRRVWTGRFRVGTFKKGDRWNTKTCTTGGSRRFLCLGASRVEGRRRTGRDSGWGRTSTDGSYDLVPLPKESGDGEWSYQPNKG